MPWIVDASSPSLPARPEAAERDAAVARALQAAQPNLARLIQRLLGWPCAADVDDAVQETMLRAWAKRAQFRGDAAFRTWLHSIAVRSARNHQRSRIRRLRWFGGRPVEADDLTDATAAPCPVEARDQARAVREAVQELPHRYREVLVLRYLEGHSIADTAELMGLRRNTADARLSRARGRLEGVLRQRGWEQHL